MIKNADFIAELRYRTIEQGGRKTPVSSGYRPQLKFNFTEMQTTGHQFFIRTDLYILYTLEGKLRPAEQGQWGR